MTMFLTSWRVSWRHNVIFDVLCDSHEELISCHYVLFDSMTLPWPHVVLLNIITYFLASWRIFDDILYIIIIHFWRHDELFGRRDVCFTWWQFWRHDVFLTSWRIFCTSWRILDIITNFLTWYNLYIMTKVFGVMTNLLRSWQNCWRTFYVMIYFLTSWRMCNYMMHFLTT